MTDTCPSLLAWLENDFPEEESQLLSTHVPDCDECREKIALMNAVQDVGDEGSRFPAERRGDATLEDLSTVAHSVSVPWFPRHVGEMMTALVVTIAVALLSASAYAQAPSWAEDDAWNRRVLIQGGTFLMGSAEAPGVRGASIPTYDPDAFDGERPQHQVTLSDFYLQEHEVTNGEYRRFDPDHRPDARDNHPVGYVSWGDAMAYAEWLGGTLPTEAQWEFAARGRDGRKYPWGDEDVTCERANYAECERTAVAVKSYEAGATPEGIYDLAGNVWEWCLDWYAPYESTGQTDPTGPAESSLSRPARVLRGGSFSFNPWYLRAAIRFNYYPDVRGVNIGFRVAWASSGGLE